MSVRYHIAMPVTLTCTVCGTQFTRPPSHAKRVAVPSCSRRCNGVLRGRDWATYGHLGPKAKTSPPPRMVGAENPAWKGGVTLKRPKGNYPSVRYIRAPDWARPMARTDGYVMEHRLVMAQMIGRLLDRSEVVHHRNHDPLDNRPANLELWPDNGSHKRAEAGRFVEGAANRLPA